MFPAGRDTHVKRVKASACAAGKGVVLPESNEEAEAVLKRIMQDKEFGDAGDEVLTIYEQHFNQTKIALSSSPSQA